jgi:hypothetical protein
MCDVVQDDRDEFDGEQVSNFVLPLYFTPTADRGRQAAPSRLAAVGDAGRRGARV